MKNHAFCFLSMISVSLSVMIGHFQPHFTSSGWFSTSTTETSSYSFWHITKTELDKAWDIHTGHSAVKIGLIDTGIDSTHPDFTGRLDESLSVSFSPNSTDPFSPLHEHGTQMAGLLAANENNGYGVGTNWQADIVCIRADGPETFPGDPHNLEENYSTIYPAIQYASQHSIPIVSFSGGLTGLTASQISNIASAMASYSGLFVCAAGNSNYDLDTIPNSDKIYPQCLPNIPNMLVVGASDSNDDKTYFSNYGENSVHVFAPGIGIRTSDLYYYVTNDCTGTSPACAIVAGIVSLIMSVNPSLTVSQVKNIILSTADYSSSLDGKCVSGGRVNAYKALKAAIPQYVDSGNGMSLPHNIRVGTNEWVKINGYGGMKHIHSTGYCPASGALYSSNIDSGPIASSSPDSSYPYNYHIYKSLNSSATYYLKSVVQLPLGSAFGVQLETHSHNYDSYQWVSLTSHKQKCSACGALSMSMQPHAVTVDNPTVCVLCGGQASGGINPFDDGGSILLTQEEKEALLFGWIEYEELLGSQT